VSAKSSSQDLRALQELVDDYACYADRSLIERQIGLFTADARLSVHDYVTGRGTPEQEIVGHGHLATRSAALRSFEWTVHLNGKGVFDIDGDTARGETSCIVYHVLTEDPPQVLVVRGLHYTDAFVRAGSGWLGTHRVMRVEWQQRGAIAH
jgi:SnoaL-like domain